MSTPQMSTARLKAEEQLRVDIARLRMTRWSGLQMIARASPEYLNSMGYRNMSNGEALLAAFLSADKEIEAVLRRFEKEHP